MTQPSNSQRGGQEQQSDYFYPFMGINPFDPPDMKTFVYAPEVRILIARGHKQYDVSRDVIRGTVIRKENSASSLFFTLANKGDYNGLFQRMDRVVVFLKRVRWQQVFSGYLDTVPFAQLYGGAAEYKATCTLKRLLHTWWTPTLPASQGLFDQALFSSQVGGDGQLPADSGLGNMLRRLLCMVGGWQPQDVHIQNFPMVFYDFLRAQLVAKRQLNHTAGEDFKRLLLGKSYNNSAPGAYAGYSNDAGPPGPAGKGEPHYIAQIVAACDSLGLGPRTDDLINSQKIAQAAGEAGSGSRDPAAKAGFTQISEVEATRNQSVQTSDAAILGVACAMVETGGGTTILNLANPSVPDSLKFSYDGMGQDHKSIGIFQQQDAGWGTVSQRMDPRQSATMFFTHLPPDWRNMAPGDAIQRVQRSAFPAKYAAAIPLATQKVQAYRAAQKGVSTVVAASPFSDAVTAAGTAVGMNPAMMANMASSTPSSVEDVRSRLGKPNPDSEGAVQTILANMGKPYEYGAKGADTFDCSGLMAWGFRSIGKADIGSTWSIIATVPRVDPSQVQRGDLIILNDGNHVEMYYGPGVMIGTGGPNGIPGGAHPLPPVSEWHSVHRVCPNGGIDPTSPRFDPRTLGPGTPVGTGDSTGGTGQDEPIAQNLFAYQFTPARFARDISMMFTQDHKEFIDSEPLIQMVQAVARASLRNFASGPDGSFMSYYPDYFGLDGKKAIVRLEDIELRDVKINFSDDNLTTHVYVAGDHTFLGQEPNLLAWLESAGSVTVEHDWLFQRLQRIAPGDLGGINGQELMRRFGVRPLKMPVAMAGSESLEFLLACQLFMEKWAQQYQTSVSFTFLPELFPGMRIILGGHDLQVYVSEVTHTFDWENGFSTSAVIMAPSRTDNKTAMSGSNGYFGGVDDTSVMRGLGFNADGTTSAEVTPQ